MIRPTGGHFSIHTIKFSRKTRATINNTINEGVTEGSHSYKKIPSLRDFNPVSRFSKADF